MDRTAALFGALPGQEIGKKEYLEDCEQDEQLDQDDGPQGFAYGHAPEPVEVEPEDLFDCLCRHTVAMFYQN